jgi:hypothetical protein
MRLVVRNGHKRVGRHNDEALGRMGRNRSLRRDSSLAWRTRWGNID